MIIIQLVLRVVLLIIILKTLIIEKLFNLKFNSQIVLMDLKLLKVLTMNLKLGINLQDKFKIRKLSIMKKFLIQEAFNKRLQIMTSLCINKTIIIEWEACHNNINKNSKECMRKKNTHMNLLKEKKYLKEENLLRDLHLALLFLDK